MNEPKLPEETLFNATPEEIYSALFVHLVHQHANMALMLLGRLPHPAGGEQIIDIEAAKTFIDQLEAIEFKTKGNLSVDEDKLLKNTLARLHQAFAEEIDKQSSGSNPSTA